MSITEEPVVKVTLDVIFAELIDLKLKLITIPEQVADHETRIRAGEKLTTLTSAGLIAQGREIVILRKDLAGFALVLESLKPKRINWLALVTAIGAGAAVLFTIFDRLYPNA